MSYHSLNILVSPLHNSLWLAAVVETQLRIEGTGETPVAALRALADQLEHLTKEKK